jgi:hypothetical protein
MEITLTANIPDEVAAALKNGTGAEIGRVLLELAAIKLYEDERISSRDVQEMLSFEDREQLYEFFKHYNVRDPSFTMEELERGRATMAALLDKR